MQLLSLVIWLCSFQLLYSPVLGTYIGVDYGNRNMLAMLISPDSYVEFVLSPAMERKDLAGFVMKGSKRIYGLSASSLMERYPQNVVMNLKSLIGQLPSSEDSQSNFSDYLSMHPGLPVYFNDRKSLSYKIDGDEYSIEELNAMYMREILDRSNKVLHMYQRDGMNEVTDVAVAIPQYFSQGQRGALLDSMRIADANVDTVLLDDGMSVAVNYAATVRWFETGALLNLVVYDMGDDSVQASLITLYQSPDSSMLQLELVGYAFSKDLSGKHFTNQLSDFLINNFLETHPTVSIETLHNNPTALAKFQQAAEEAKITLSTKTETTVTVGSVLPGVDFSILITREIFEQTVSTLLKQVLLPIEDMIQNQFGENTLQLEDINGVIINGGGTRMPIIKKILAHYVGEDKVIDDINLDESVVDGVTARVVNKFKGNGTRTYDIIDRTTSAYSVQLSNEDNKKSNLVTIFDKGSKYPCKKSYILRITDKILPDIRIYGFDNEEKFRTFQISTDKLKSVFKSLRCNNGYAYNVTFSINDSKIFGIDESSIVCLDKSFIQLDTNTELLGEHKMIPTHKLKSPKTNILESLEISSRGTIIDDFKSEELLKSINRLNSMDLEEKHHYEMTILMNNLKIEVNESKSYAKKILSSKEVSMDAQNEFTNHIQKSSELINSGIKKTTFTELNDAVISLKNHRKKIIFLTEIEDTDLELETLKKLEEDAEDTLQTIFEDIEEETNLLLDLQQSFINYGQNINRQLNSIEAPKQLQNKLKNWNSTVESLKLEYNELKHLLETNTIDITDKEKLFHLKRSLKSDLSETKKMYPYFLRDKKHRIINIQKIYDSIKNRSTRNLERYGINDPMFRGPPKVGRKQI